jgi:predicted outer membrane repeat protein
MDCTFTNNKALGYRGAAIRTSLDGSFGDLAIEAISCLFAKNTAKSHGGGVSAEGTAMFTNRGFSGNVAGAGTGGAGSGGGIYRVAG